MNDLLTGSLSIPRGRSSRQDDIEIGTQRSGELGLIFFFEKVNITQHKVVSLWFKEVEQPYEKLYALLRKLQGAHEESKLVTRASDMKAIKHRMEKDVDEVGRVARFIKSKIEELDRDNLANRRRPGCGQGSGVDRTRTVATVALKKKFKDRMFEFQILKENIQQEHREVVERRVFTVTGARPNEEVHCAVDHVQSGTAALQRAKSLQKSSRKWMCMAMLIFFMIVAIVLVSVLKPFHSRNGA